MGNRTRTVLLTTLLFAVALEHFDIAKSHIRDVWK